jgi:hypothetical protein
MTARMASDAFVIVAMPSTPEWLKPVRVVKTGGYVRAIGGGTPESGGMPPLAAARKLFLGIAGSAVESMENPYSSIPSR